MKRYCVIGYRANGDSARLRSNLDYDTARAYARHKRKTTRYCEVTVEDMPREKGWRIR